MAQFNMAFEKMIIAEGGYKLHEIKGDRGGMTYAGISRKYNPYWKGWTIIDKDYDDPSLSQMVRDFYKENYWNKIRGNDIKEQSIASSIFDFSVNAGVKVSSKLTQIILGATPDGIIGDKTIGLLNKFNQDLFIISFAIMKIKRYAYICNKDKSQNKFLLGWINRTLGGLENV